MDLNARPALVHAPPAHLLGMSLAKVHASLQASRLNGIVWILLTGARWRDLPERYGRWQTVASRFYRWRRASLFQRLLDALTQQADATGQLHWVLPYVDSTVIRAHQHAAGAKSGSRPVMRSGPRTIWRC